MKLSVTTDQMKNALMALFAVYAVMLLPMDAMATDPTGLSNVLCNVVHWFTGPIGTGIATLAIIVIGVGALMGKVSWGMAIIVGLGVGVIFGAPSIVEALGGNSTGC
ncbi:MAG: TrbC/VirB2 family protein [Rickettsiales bacterium]